MAGVMRSVSKTNIVFPVIIGVIFVALIFAAGIHINNSSTNKSGENILDKIYIDETFDSSKPSSKNAEICKKAKEHEYKFAGIKTFGSSKKKAVITEVCTVCAKTKDEKKDLSIYYIGAIVLFLVLLFVSICKVFMFPGEFSIISLVLAIAVLVLALLLCMFIRQNCYGIEMQWKMIALCTLIQVIAAFVICCLLYNEDTGAFSLSITLATLAIGHTLSGIMFPNLYQYGMWVTSVIYLIAQVSLGVFFLISDENKALRLLSIGSLASVASIVLNVMAIK